LHWVQLLNLLGLPGILPTLQSIQSMVNNPSVHYWSITGVELNLELIELFEFRISIHVFGLNISHTSAPSNACLEILLLVYQVFKYSRWWISSPIFDYQYMHCCINFASFQPVQCLRTK
jgi:hypothetical protein